MGAATSTLQTYQMAPQMMQWLPSARRFTLETPIAATTQALRTVNIAGCPCASLMGCLQPVLLVFLTCGSSICYLASSGLICCPQEQGIGSRPANDSMPVSLPVGVALLRQDIAVPAASLVVQPGQRLLPGMLDNRPA